MQRNSSPYISHPPHMSCPYMSHHVTNIYMYESADNFVYEFIAGQMTYGAMIKSYNLCFTLIPCESKNNVLTQIMNLTQVVNIHHLG